MIRHITPEQINAARQDIKIHGSNPVQTQTNSPIDFSSILAEKISSSELKFSSHAEKRLAMRGIELSRSDIDDIKKAVDLAESKGSRDALILHSKAAFVVSVRNRTVITAIDDSNMKERVVTNIDSAVLAGGFDDLRD
jgi:flagellar operon protein